MIVKLRTMIQDAKENEKQFDEKEFASKEEAIFAKEIGKDSYVHLCFHDEKPVKPCRLVKI